MTISEAIALATDLTGQVLPNTILVRWLSEFDGKLAVTFFHEDEWEPYNPATDMNKDLLVPYPYDGTYVDYLAAMTSYSRAEYDRYESSKIMSDKTLSDYKAYMMRTHARPCQPGFPIDRGD